MKLKELFEDNYEELELDPTKGAGYSDDEPKEKGKLTTRLLRRKADKNNPAECDDTKPDDSTADRNPGDDPDHRRLGAGLQ